MYLHNLLRKILFSRIGRILFFLHFIYLHIQPIVLHLVFLYI